MKRINFFSSILLSVLFAFTACEKPNDNPNSPDDPQSSGESTVIVMDSETVSQSLESISESGTLIFSGLPANETPKTDDIICSAPTDNAPRGFLYRVTKVSASGGKTVIETCEVSLEEAIENADVSETISLDGHIAGVFDEAGNPLEYTTSSDELRAGVTGKVTIKVENSYSGIAIAGSLSISNTLEFDLDIKKWSLQYMKFAYTGEVELKATIGGELKVGGKKPLWNVKIASIKLTPITILVAGVPVVITPEIPIYLKGELEGTLKGEFTLFDSKNSVTVGVKYENKAVEGIFETKSSESKPLAERVKVSLSGELKTTVEPGVSFLLYNSKNASMGATIGVYGKAALELTLLSGNQAQLIETFSANSRYALNPELTINAGVEAGVNAKLKIFNPHCSSNQNKS